MKIHRFIGPFDLSKSEFEIEGEIAHQITKVLKLKVGEKIELCDGKGISAMAEIVEMGKNKVAVKKAPTSKVAEVPTKNVGENKVFLFCAVLKKENFEMVVQKTTECGVAKIIPIISARTIKTGVNLERLRKIAREASEQSGRINVPEISEPITFEKSLELFGKNECNLFFDGSGELFYKTPWERDGASTRNFSAEKYPCVLENNSPRPINIFIGPEGGWTLGEVEKAKNLNFKIASLGPLTLRGETAAIVATYLWAN
jgi:16S rRNA (uracil1498-N3)-methyltransferase